MQPLSYQILPCSCWVTSMLNGLLLLCGNKNRMSGFVYRMIHAVLTDEGVPSNGRQKRDLNTAIEAIAIHSGLRIRHYLGPDVEDALRKLTFQNQVALCDIDSGGHVILLTGRSCGWIEAFDPDWHNVKVKREKPDAYVVQPHFGRHCKRCRVNVLIAETHLLHVSRGRNREFQMGAVSSRSLTVMQKRRTMPKGRPGK
ncbi:MAG: hypothetical protein WDM70_08275 [Nitrosomonadales bacterium]